jgi:hypothetical protein
MIREKTQGLKMATLTRLQLLSYTMVRKCNFPAFLVEKESLIYLYKLYKSRMIREKTGLENGHFNQVISIIRLQLFSYTMVRKCNFPASLVDKESSGT